MKISWGRKMGFAYGVMAGASGVLGFTLSPLAFIAIPVALFGLIAYRANDETINGRVSYGIND